MSEVSGVRSARSLSLSLTGRGRGRVCGWDSGWLTAWGNLEGEPGGCERNRQMWAVAAADMASGLMFVSVSTVHVRRGWQLRARDALPAEVLAPRVGRRPT